MSSQGLKRTPLYECHKAAGAKFTEFGGWEMPVQYSGLVDEHNTVREKVGMFDVSHMGEVSVKGPQALEALQYMTSNNVSKLFPGKAQYSLLTNEQGGVVDDIIVYHLADGEYLVCVNAANADKDFAWMTQQNAFDCIIENVSAEYAQIAVQGPAAASVVTELLELSDDELSSDNFPFFCFQETHSQGAKLKDIDLLLARTGYTGEDGFEIFCAAEESTRIWDGLMEVGKAYGLKPAGLGARDTLRLEACLPLHGHELSDDINALESGLGWVVKLKKGEFIGRDVLEKVKKEGPERKLVGFRVLDKGIVRDGAPIFTAEGTKIGISTSGTKTPTVGVAIGLGFVEAAHAEIGTVLLAEVRGKSLKIELVPTPFYRRS